MIGNNILNKVLLEPFAAGYDELLILTAHATPQMASWLLKCFADKRNAAVSVKLIIGMSADGIGIRSHTGFKELHGKKYAGTEIYFECSYIEGVPQNNSNLYVWLKDGQPKLAFAGTAEFLQKILVTETQKEIMLECDPSEALRYYREEERRSIYCNHSEVENSIRIISAHSSDEDDIIETVSAAGENVDSVTLSLLTDKGEVAARSGLNWGQREGRNPNEAYIRLPVNIARSGFFPLECQFSVDTDDGKYFILRVEQQNNKAITTPDSNARLGEYFRYRLGLANGAMITKEHLEAYGRTSVTFIKIDEETFYMDFSPHHVE